MKLNLFRVIVPVLLVFIQPLEAQTLISTPNLRQGESTFALFLNTSPQLKNSSISSSIRAVKANTEISAEAWKPAEGAWHQTGYTATIRYKDASLGSVFLGFALPKDPGILPGNYWDYVSISGMGQEVQARWDIGLGAVLFLLGVPVNAPIGEASVIVTGPDGLEVSRLSTFVVKRDFRRDDIRLDEALTSLRVDSDPLKDAQARRYLALLGTTNTDAVFMNRGFVRPVAGERRTSLFGDIRKFIYADNASAWGTHNGVDYGYPTGTPVWAAGRGRVAMAEDRIVTGKTVVIEHLPGVYTIYMHLHTITVQLGEIVEMEQGIGTIGATGLATGPHLHWELRVSSIPCDPEALTGLDKMPRIRTMTAAIEGR